VRATPRVGVGFAGPVWAAKRWRFAIVPERVAELREICGGKSMVVGVMPAP
jgi:hypothetical protein